MISSFIFSSHDLADTYKLAREWVGCVPSPALLGLTGEIGSGKTVFVKGLADALSVRPGTLVTSPTFTLMHMYEGSHRLYHFDIYRLEGTGDMHNLGMDEYMSLPDAYVAIEWGEKIRNFFAPDYSWVEIKILTETSRNITVTGFGNHAARIDQLAKKLKI